MCCREKKFQLQLFAVTKNINDFIRMNKTICTYVSGGLLSALFAHQIYKLFKKLCTRKNSMAEVLFTNDQSGCCMNKRENCNNRYCMSRVYDRFEYHIDSAKLLICIAIYMFTNDRICDAIIRAQKRGVIIRVIIDKKGYHATSSKGRDLSRHCGSSFFFYIYFLLNEIILIFIL